LEGSDLQAMAEGKAPLVLPNQVIPPEVLAIQDKLTSFLREILRTMMSCVSITAILQKIVRDHGADEFKDFKSIIITMLDTYTYERNILQTAAQLLEGIVPSTLIQSFVTQGDRERERERERERVCVCG
jgi:hypothetical protein